MSKDVGHMPGPWIPSAKMFVIIFSIMEFQKYLLYTVEYKCSMNTTQKKVSEIEDDEGEHWIAWYQVRDEMRSLCVWTEVLG